MRILVVEDDPVLMNGLQVGLGLHGFMADAAATLEEARAAPLGADTRQLKTRLFNKKGDPIHRDRPYSTVPNHLQLNSANHPYPGAESHAAAGG